MAELDQAKVEAFTQAMTGILNGGTLALMTSIGTRRDCSRRLPHCRPPPAGRLPMRRA